MTRLNDLADAYALDRRLVRRAFEKLAAGYEASSGPDREIGERLLDHLAPVRIAPRLILDLGSGTGGCSRRLLDRYRKAAVVAVDIAAAMLRESRQREPRFWSRQRYACADAEKLGMAAERFDLVYSNLTLLWCNDIDQVFAELRRVLRPGGLLALSTLGPDTLMELRSAWAQVDDYQHVHAFIDMHDIGDALLRAGFVDVVMDTERLTFQYQTLDGLLEDLKTLGTGNLVSGRRKTLTGRSRLEAFRQIYKSSAKASGVSATCEVTYAHAWIPEARGVAVPLTKL